MQDQHKWRHAHEIYLLPFSFKCGQPICISCFTCQTVLIFVCSGLTGCILYIYCKLINKYQNTSNVQLHILQVLSAEQLHKESLMTHTHVFVSLLRHHFGLFHVQVINVRFLVYMRAPNQSTERVAVRRLSAKTRAEKR